MNDRLRMLASRYYSGVWVTSIDCLTLSWRAKYHTIVFPCLMKKYSDNFYHFFYTIKCNPNHPNQFCLLGNLIELFFVKLTLHNAFV